MPLAAAEERPMKIVVATPVRLLVTDWNACFSGRPSMCVDAVLCDLPGLRETLRTLPADVVHVDVTLGTYLFRRPRHRSGVAGRSAAKLTPIILRTYRAKPSDIDIE